MLLIANVSISAAFRTQKRHEVTHVSSSRPTKNAHTKQEYPMPLAHGALQVSACVLTFGRFDDTEI